MNLYFVTDCCYESGAFVFAESGNKAKSMMVNHFSDDEPYTYWRYQTLVKNVDEKQGGKIIDYYDDDGYDYVQQLGFEFKEETEVR